MVLNCNCSNKSISKNKIDVTHTIFGQNILVKNTPVLVCDNCERSEYQNPDMLYYQLKDAYRNREYTINYSEDYNA